MTEPNVITTIVLQGREYLVKMNVCNKYLEMVIADKHTGEEWQCSYDQAYIENLTHKTGNFKQYDVFVAMIKSGLLKTSDCISLDLLTFEDLDTLRTKKIRSHCRQFNNSHGNNRRYLIVNYSVEFDRIHYPLPLEYCGPPDPLVLQATIRKLEAELSKAREELTNRDMKPDARQILVLQRRVEDLMLENSELRNEISELQAMAERGPKNQVKLMQKAIVNLEKSVLSERKSHHQLVDKLRSDKIRLNDELEKCKRNEKWLKTEMDRMSRTSSINRLKPHIVKREKSELSTLGPVFQRQQLIKSKSDNTGNRYRTRSLSPRATKSEDCENLLKRNKNIKKTSKSRSRSTSASSRNVDFTEIIRDTSSSIPKRRKKRRQKPSASRSTSRESTDNSSLDNYEVFSARGIRSRLRNSDKDFMTLESRILALQDILKDSTLK